MNDLNDNSDKSRYDLIREGSDIFHFLGPEK